MKRLIEFAMEDGESVWVEVEGAEAPGGNVRVGRLHEGLEKAHVSFERSLDKLCSATEKVIQRLSSLGSHPDEIEMEFGINFSGEVGVYIGSASAASNYKVTMRWHDRGDQAKPQN